jgi:hypothetical protein
MTTPGDDHNNPTDAPVVLLRAARGPFHELVARHTACAIHDVAVLCEVAGVGYMDKRDLLTPYADLLARMRRANIDLLPQTPLCQERLALFVGGRMPHLFEKDLLAAETAPALDPADPATRAAIIDRALQDTGAFIAPVREWLATGNNVAMGRFIARDDNVLQLFDGPLLTLRKTIDGAALFARVNAELENRGLAPLPAPFAPPPPRGDGPPKLRLL